MNSVAGESLLHDETIVTFLVAATQYCALVEPESTPHWSTDTLYTCRQTLSQLYQTAVSLPEIVVRGYGLIDEITEVVVTEEQYEKIRSRLENFFGIEDRFLDAQQEDQKYSEQPVSASLSELMADLYQTLANPLWAIRQNGSDHLPETLATLMMTFEYEWGGKLLMGLKQIHKLINDPNFQGSQLEEDYIDELDMGATNSPDNEL